MFLVPEKAGYIIRINHHKTEEDRVGLFLTDQTFTKFTANADQERRTALPAERRPCQQSKLAFAGRQVDWPRIPEAGPENDFSSGLRLGGTGGPPF